MRPDWDWFHDQHKQIVKFTLKNPHPSPQYASIPQSNHNRPPNSRSKWKLRLEPWKPLNPGDSDPIHAGASSKRSPSPPSKADVSHDLVLEGLVNASLSNDPLPPQMK